MKEGTIKILISITLLSQIDSGFTQQFIPGGVYYDSTSYVEYRAGNLPIIISAPHGGYLEPNTIPDRVCTGCVTIRDAYTKEVTEGLYESILEETGCYPHVIINLLHRKKFDANRSITTAAVGNPTVEDAWFNYHEFIDSAKAQVVKDYGRGLFLEIHGHGHTIQRIEVGYLLSANELQLPDSTLNTLTYIEETSIRTLTTDNIQNLSHSDLIRGQYSFGTLMDNKGFPSVPSTSDPFPNNGEPYFSGGHNTVLHGSRDNEGKIDAIQLELNQGIRFDSAIREATIDSIAITTLEYINYHYNNQFSDNFCDLIFLNNSDYDRHESELKLYPNPASSYFELTSNLNRLNITIYNSFGQTVSSEVWNGNRIDIDFLTSGFYFIELKQNNVLMDVLKLVKQ